MGDSSFQFLNKLLILLSIGLLTLSTVQRASCQESHITQGDSTWMVRGRVVESISKSPLMQVHIINLSLNRATLSGREGEFILESRPGDTVYFSYVGYKKRLVGIKYADTDTGAVLQVILYEDTIMLKKFRVFAASVQVQFRSDFISRTVVPDTLNPAFEAFRQENHFSAPNTSGLVLPGPFTLIYENFNKRARLKRRIERNRSEYYENLPEEEKQKVLFNDD